MKRTIKFLDKERCLVSVTIDTNRGYLAMTGERNGHYGQIKDYIVPKKEYQQQLIDIWREYHIVRIDPTICFDELIEEICDMIEEIEEIEAKRKEKFAILAAVQKKVEKEESKLASISLYDMAKANMEQMKQHQLTDAQGFKLQ